MKQDIHRLLAAIRTVEWSRVQHATREFVMAGKDTYVQLLQGQHAGTRIAVAYLLGIIGAADFDTLEEVMKAAQGVTL